MIYNNTSLICLVLSQEWRFLWIDAYVIHLKIFSGSHSNNLLISPKITPVKGASTALITKMSCWKESLLETISDRSKGRAGVQVARTQTNGISCKSKTNPRTLHFAKRQTALKVKCPCAPSHHSGYKR